MAKADVEKLIQYSKEHDSKESDMGMDYDTGHSSKMRSLRNLVVTLPPKFESFNGNLA